MKFSTMMTFLKLFIVCVLVFPQVVVESGSFTAYSILALYIYLECLVAFNRRLAKAARNKERLNGTPRERRRH